MADYIYLLENRLSAAQRSALRTVREISKTKGLTVFLVGGAARDLTSGSPVRDLDVVVQGNALKLLKDLERAGVTIVGEHDPMQTLYTRFPGGVRMEVGSTLSLVFSKPGKANIKSATILEDLRRRDFTANSMALSLNEGSYGLLMDPLNGVADIENRQLRLVSNYGFIEDPVRMIRGARLMARLGWTMDEKTQGRYETGKQEGYISVLNDFQRGVETEEIIHEEDPLRVMKRLEAEGWMKILAPFWTSAKVNVPELERMRDTQTQLQMQGIHPDPAAANFPLLTAKLSPKELATLKAAFPRKGFVAEIEALEGEAREFATLLAGKGAASASGAWKAITGARPEAVLWTAFSTKSPALHQKFKSFSSDWPQARHKIPYTMMQEMRIVPEIAGYEDLLEKLFFALMDGGLGTPEEMKAFLEPFSPPAPPPPVSMRRLRAAKTTKSRSKKVVKPEESDDESLDAEAAPTSASADVVSGPEEISAGHTAKPGKAVKQPEARSAPPKPAKAPEAKPTTAKPTTVKPVAHPAPHPPAPTARKKAAEAINVPVSKVAAKQSVKAAPAKAVKAPVKKVAAPSKKSPAKIAARPPVRKTATSSGKTLAAKKNPPKKSAPAKAGKTPARKPAVPVKSKAKTTPVKSGKRK